MKTKYDWRNIPDRVYYVAIQRNGDKFGYEVAPVLHETGYWVSYVGQVFFLDNIGPCENWKDSLEKRPDTLGTKEEIETIVKFILQDEDTDCGNEVLCSVIASRCAEQIMERFNLKP